MNKAPKSRCSATYLGPRIDDGTIFDLQRQRPFPRRVRGRRESKIEPVLPGSHRFFRVAGCLRSCFQTDGTVGFQWLHSVLSRADVHLFKTVVAIEWGHGTIRPDRVSPWAGGNYLGYPPPSPEAFQVGWTTGPGRVS